MSETGTGVHSAVIMLLDRGNENLEVLSVDNDGNNPPHGKPAVILTAGFLLHHHRELYIPLILIPVQASEHFLKSE